MPLGKIISLVFVFHLLCVVLQGCERSRSGVFAQFSTQYPVASVGFSDDGRYIAVLERMGKVRCWALSSHEPLPSLSPASAIQIYGRTLYTAFFTPDGLLLKSRNLKKSEKSSTRTFYKISSVKTSSSVRKIQVGPRLAFSPNGKSISICFQDALVLVELGEQRSVKLIHFDEKVGGVVSYSGDGEWIVAAENHGKVLYIVNARKPRPLAPNSINQPNEICSVSCSETGEVVACAMNSAIAQPSDHILVWNVSMRKLVKTIYLGVQVATGPPMAFSNQENLFASASNRASGIHGTSGSVHIWNTKSWDRLIEIPLGHSSGGFHNQMSNCVTALAFSPDGKKLAIGGWEEISAVSSQKRGIVRIHQLDLQD